MALYLKEGLSYGIYGLLIGGGIGIVQAYRKTRPSSNVLNPPADPRYQYILQDPEAAEMINQFKTYQSIIPEEYETIIENLNKLIELHIKMLNQDIEIRYLYRATTCVANIRKALNLAKNKVRHVSVPHWETDEQNMMTIAEDYLFNINQDINNYMVSSRRSS